MRQLSPCRCIDLALSQVAPAPCAHHCQSLPPGLEALPAMLPCRRASATTAPMLARCPAPRRAAHCLPCRCAATRTCGARASTPSSTLWWANCWMTLVGAAIKVLGAAKWVVGAAITVVGAAIKVPPGCQALRLCRVLRGLGVLPSSFAPQVGFVLLCGVHAAALCPTSCAQRHPHGSQFHHSWSLAPPCHAAERGTVTGARLEELRRK